MSTSSHADTAKRVSTARSDRGGLTAVLLALAIVAYFAVTAYVAHSSLHIQSLVTVAAVFGILAISLDMAVGMLGLYSLGQGGFFAIGAYLTTILVDTLWLESACSFCRSPSWFPDVLAPPSAPPRCASRGCTSPSRRSSSRSS